MAEYLPACLPKMHIGGTARREVQRIFSRITIGVGEASTVFIGALLFFCFVARIALSYQWQHRCHWMVCELADGGRRRGRLQLSFFALAQKNLLPAFVLTIRIALIGCLFVVRRSKHSAASLSIPHGAACGWNSTSHFFLVGFETCTCAAIFI